MNSRLPYLRNKTAQLSLSPGVYIMKNSKGEIIYIGKAKKLKNRVTSYFREGAEHNPKVQAMVDHVYDYDFITTTSEFEALVLECNLIKQHKPKYNILLKDDKGYHYIRVSDDAFPKITCETNTKAGGRYIGPYMSGTVVKETVNEVNRMFKLPTCNLQFPRDCCKRRPCLNFHIKNCMGVCKGHITQEEYNSVIEQAIGYIKNGSKKSIELLTEQMNKAAEELNFEKAAVLRDRINAIRKSAEQQNIFIDSKNSIDVIGEAKYSGGNYITVIEYRESKLFSKTAFDITSADSDQIEQFIVQYYSNKKTVPERIILNKVPDNIRALEAFLIHINKNQGVKISIQTPTSEQDKMLLDLANNNSREYAVLKLKTSNHEAEALEQLKNILGLKKTPTYIESYDISNLGNQHIVSGQVVFENGKPQRRAYRKYELSSQTMQNDYKSMSDTIELRINSYIKAQTSSSNSSDKHLPDLILLDGGKQHVSIVKSTLSKYKLQITVFGMVKDDKHKTKALTDENSQIDINKITQSAVFNLLERIQNEVHRYAVKFMHKTYNKNTYRSELENIKGIGPQKAQALLIHFKSVDALRQASIEDIQNISGISKELAREIYSYLHQ